MRNMISKNVIKVMFIAAVITPAICNAQQYVLLAKPSPVNAGTVQTTPSDNGMVTLSAQARDGYQFVYWLGDVSDPVAQTTSVSTDSPKLVIAIYERTDYETQIPLGSAGGIMNTASNARNNAPGPGPSVVTGAAPSAPVKPFVPVIPNFDFPENPDQPEERFDDAPPVPDEPIPEPSTLTLFALAGLALIKTKRK